MPELITSAQNPKIKFAFKLKERSFREETALFLIEGYREIERAQRGGVRFETVFVCPELFLGTNEQALLQKMENKVLLCAPHVFEKLSYRDRPDGLIAVAHQMKRSLKDLVLASKPPFLLIAEAIEKPGNLGSMLRSADAAGVDAVIVCDRCTDIYNPNVVRASVGTLFTQPVIEATSVETLQFLSKNQIQVVSATPHAEREFTDTDLTGPVALVVGTEQLGLSQTWLNACDKKVRIPMLGSADSLNVATAATLLLYEVHRQRKSTSSCLC